MWVDTVGNGHRLNPLGKVQVDPKEKTPLRQDLAGFGALIPPESVTTSFQALSSPYDCQGKFN